MLYDAAIIGGGAAGLLAGGELSRAGLKTVMIEKKALATKLRITGKGRCNVTNDSSPEAFLAHIVSNSKFLMSSSRGFTSADVMALFRSLGVPLKTERGARVFPESDDAGDIAGALIGYARGCEVVYRAAQAVVLADGRACGVRLADGQTLCARCVLLAAGGASYPATGSNGDGFRIAAAAGHRIIDPAPALVGISLKGTQPGELQGLSLKNVRLVCKRGGKTLFEELGEMQFTHFGISGPLVLSLSSRINRISPAELELYIDFKPALTREVLDRRLQREFAAHPNQELKTVLCGLLPRALAPIAAARSGGSGKVNQLTAAQRARVVETLKCFTLCPAGLRPIAEGIVTAGGVDTRQIDPRTMQSRLIPGLYFAGEVIDVDALTGGFNLQSAFSTAHAAAGAIIKYIEGENENGSNRN